MSEENTEGSAAFPAVGLAQWRERVREELNGADPDQRLAQRRAGSPDLRPAFGAEDRGAEHPDPGAGDFVRGTRGDLDGHPRPWRAWADLDWQAAGAADLARFDLERELDGLVLRGDGSGAELAAWLGSVDLGAASVALDAFAGRGLEQARVLATCGASAAFGGLDPLREARLGADFEREAWSSELRELAGSWGAGRPLAADARDLAEEGAGPALVLGWLLAATAEQARWAEAAGVDLGQRASELSWRLPLDLQVFEGIALLRAARLAWSSLLAACDVHGVAPHLEVFGSLRGHATRDPFVNMLRSSGQAFAGIVGGADALQLPHFDGLLGQPDSLGRRVARNTHTVLSEESGLGRVVDPAGGSYYLEARTRQLAEAAWSEFQAIEAAGGAWLAQSSGELSARIARDRAARREQFASRKRAVLGVSEFADPLEARPVRQARALSPESGQRDAQPFEGLRDWSDWQREQGHPPAVALVVVGSRAGARARLGFARNLLSAAGLELVELEPQTKPDGAARRSAPQRCAAAMLCGSDEDYAAHAPELAAALQAADFRSILLAGKPGEHADAWSAAGVTGYAFLGCDAVDLLSGLLESLGAELTSEVQA
jgi:methylmalonyl-CoA mutase